MHDLVDPGRTVRVALTGRLPPSDSGLVIGRWLRSARGSIDPSRVSGGMLFDGERWLLLMRGRQADLATVEAMRQLRNDAAFGCEAEYLDDALDTAPPLTGWHVGYIEPERLEGLHGLLAREVPRGMDALSVALCGSDTD